MRSQKSVFENNHWKNVTPHPVPLRWGGAAQRRGGQSGQETIATLPHTLSLVIARAAWQSI